MNESNKYQCDTTCVSLQVVTKRDSQAFAVCAALKGHSTFDSNAHKTQNYGWVVFLVGQLSL